MGTLLSKHSIRTLFLAILSLFFCTYGSLAREKPDKPVPAIQEVDGYTIRAVHIGGGTYGYEIRKGPDILVRQKRNPFTGSAVGLKNKEDAMKTATWVVQTVLKNEEMRPRNKRLPERMLPTRSIPRTVARELHITID